jgi:hypothetical protein
VLPLPPRRSVMTSRSAHVMPCCLRPTLEGSASKVYFLSRPPVGSLSLRPGDSLTIPRMALSVGFIPFVSSTDATKATGLLTLALVGLTPTEHASLRWTTLGSKNRSQGSFAALKWQSFRQGPNLIHAGTASVNSQRSTPTRRHPWLPRSISARPGGSPCHLDCSGRLLAALSSRLAIIVVQHSA